MKKTRPVDSSKLEVFRTERVPDKIHFQANVKVMMISLWSNTKPDGQHLLNFGSWCEPVKQWLMGKTGLGNTAPWRTRKRISVEKFKTHFRASTFSRERVLQICWLRLRTRASISFLQDNAQVKVMYRKTIQGFDHSSQAEWPIASFD